MLPSILKTKSGIRHVSGPIDLMPDRPPFIRFDGDWPTFSITATYQGSGIVAAISWPAQSSRWLARIPLCIRIPDEIELRANSRDACRKIDDTTFLFDFLPAAQKSAFELLFIWAQMRDRYPHLEEACGLTVTYLDGDE